MEEGNKDSPPLKRCKLSQADDFEIKAILPDEYTKVALEAVYICKILEKKQISKLMLELTQHLPLHHTLQHLKRVHQSQILLCRKADVPRDLTLKEFLFNTKISPEWLAALSSNVDEVQVPALACKLRFQYDTMRSYWPVKFHPDKKLESLYDGTCFDSEEITFHRRIIKFLMHLSQDLESNRPCALCVDPRTKSIVAIAASHADVNPINHAPMVLVEFVARTQNSCVLKENAKIVDEKTLAGVPQKYRDYILQNDLYENFEIGAEIMKSKMDGVANSLESGGIDNLTKFGPYLCTGYDVYTTAEPCLTCAMALVHSRAKRVFFVNPSIENGALLTNFKLHGVKELNHHYEVFHCYAS